MMEGIRYVLNHKGKKVAVLIDLEMYGDLWEDIYDTIVARSRADEPKESLESVKRRLKRQGRLNG